MSIYIYICPVRCALNPPPCFLLWLFGRQVGELQNQPKRNANTIAKNVMADKWANATNIHKSIQKLAKIIEKWGGTIPGIFFDFFYDF